MKIPAASVLAGKKLSEIDVRNKRFSVLIAAIERGGEIIVPGGDTVLKEGDILSICAKHFELCDFLRCYGLLKKKVQYVMILGAGRSAVLFGARSGNVRIPCEDHFSQSGKVRGH